MTGDIAVDSGLEDTFEIVLDLVALEAVVGLPYRDLFVVDLDTSEIVVEPAAAGCHVVMAVELSEMGQKLVVVSVADCPNQL